MKTTTETKTETIEKKITTYACEFCDFTSLNERTLKAHEAEHACKETRLIEGDKFFRFESQDDMKKFCQGTQYHYGSWGGPGWYGTEIEEDYCMGSHMGQIEKLYPADRMLREDEEKRNTLSRRIKGLRDLIGPAALEDPEAKYCSRCSLELTDPDDIYADGTPLHTFESGCIAALREKFHI